MNDAILSTTTIRNLRAAVLTPSMSASRLGTPQPQIEVRLPKATHHRKANAALYALAAAIELATPAAERWVVVVDAYGNEAGRIYLDVADGTAEEVQRGLEMLRKIVSS